MHTSDCASQWFGTLGLAPLVVDVQSRASVHARDHLEVGAVEAVDADHAGLGVEVAFVRVGGVQVVLKHRQPVQVLDLWNTQGYFLFMLL